MSPDFEHAISYITPRIVTAVDRHPEDRELRQVLELLAALSSGTPAPTTPRDTVNALGAEVEQARRDFDAAVAEAFPPVSLNDYAEEAPRAAEAGDPAAELPDHVAGYRYEHLSGPRAGDAR